MVGSFLCTSNIRYGFTLARAVLLFIRSRLPRMLISSCVYMTNTQISSWCCCATGGWLHSWSSAKPCHKPPTLHGRFLHLPQSLLDSTLFAFELFKVPEPFHCQRADAASEHLFGASGVCESWTVQAVF